MIFYTSLFAEYKREVADLELAFDGVTYVQLKGFGDLRTQLSVSLRFVHFVDERLAILRQLLIGRGAPLLGEPSLLVGLLPPLSRFFQSLRFFRLFP